MDPLKTIGLHKEFVLPTRACQGIHFPDVHLSAKQPRVAIIGMEGTQTNDHLELVLLLDSYPSSAQSFPQTIFPLELSATLDLCPSEAQHRPQTMVHLQHSISPSLLSISSLVLLLDYCPSRVMLFLGSGLALDQKQVPNSNSVGSNLGSTVSHHSCNKSWHGQIFCEECLLLIETLWWREGNSASLDSVRRLPILFIPSRIIFKTWIWRDCNSIIQQFKYSIRRE